MVSRLRNPNTPSLWDKILFKENKTLLRSPFYIDKINRVFEFLRKHKGKFLDIGLGRGNLEKKIIKEGLDFDIYGVDISPKAIAAAKRKIKGSFYVANIFKLPFESSFLDVVCILDVLEHIFEKDTTRALKEVNRILKRGGGLIISVPLNENLAQLVKDEKNFNVHLREYTPQILVKELKSSGFNVLKMEFIYAFSKFYKIKSYVMRFIPGFRKPNLLIVYCIKK